MKRSEPIWYTPHSGILTLNLPDTERSQYFLEICTPNADEHVSSVAYASGNDSLSGFNELY
jgi:hypothetical protein